jgi:thiamine-phosphate pyrophosphorylase
MKFRHYKYYIFVNELNETIKKNILKISKPNLILNFKIFEESSLILAKNIIIFCKNHNIPFYILNDVKIAKQLNANGIFISATNRKIGLSLFSNIKFKLIGSAHNQLEYFFKIRQNCKTIMLSPIFYNYKYSIYKILNPIRFNLICLSWETNIGALGGILKKNINKINLTKATNIGIKSYVSEAKKNKKAHQRLTGGLDY